MVTGRLHFQPGGRQPRPVDTVAAAPLTGGDEQIQVLRPGTVPCVWASPDPVERSLSDSNHAGDAVAHYTDDVSPLSYLWSPLQIWGWRDSISCPPLLFKNYRVT